MNRLDIPVGLTDFETHDTSNLLCGLLAVVSTDVGYARRIRRESAQIQGLSWRALLNQVQHF
jgi:hypothetical protein